MRLFSPLEHSMKRVVGLLLSLVACAMLDSCGGGAAAAAPTIAEATTAAALPASTLHNMRAVHLGGNWGNNVDGIKSDTVIQQYFSDLKARNVEWIGVSVAMFVDGVANPALSLHYRPAGATAFALYTFDDGDLSHFLAAAKSQGFHLYLTLSIERNGATGTSDPTCNTPSYVPPRWLLGHTSANMTPDNLTCMSASEWWWNPDHPLHATNLATFWNSYTAIATKYAAIAQQAGVEIFSLGTETEGLFRTRASGAWIDEYGAQLQAMVTAVRSVYSGWLTYDQTYDALVSANYFTGQQQVFSDLALDIRGVSAYFPLATTARLYTEAELEGLWQLVFNQYILPAQQRDPSRPIVFLEFGYTDDVGTVVQPNTGENQPISATGITDGMQQQENVFQAFFNVNNAAGQPVRGAFVWDAEMSMPGDRFCTAEGFYLWCKPLSNVLAAVYQSFVLRDADRAFDWAQAAYAPLFPSAQASFDALGYHARFYPETSTYLGYKDGEIWLHNGKQWNYYDVGALSAFLATVAAAGY
jgi:hypothetical protein